MRSSAVKDKVFVITGSGQGLGKAFALRLLEAGGKVCLSDLSLDLGSGALQEMRERFGEDKVCLVACDVTNMDQFSSLLDQAEKYFGVECVDVLVNNAGINMNLGWRKCVEVNLLGVMTGTELALDKMRTRPGRGHQIINTASMASFNPGMEEMVGYTMAKYGVLGLTRAMANSMDNHGVQFKCINPLWVDTDMVNKVTKGRHLVKELVARHGGMMTTTHVAEGFYRLVTECNNGTALGVMPGCPYMEIPDYNRIPALALLVFLAKFVGKVVGPSVVKTNHYIVTFSVMIVLLLIFVAVIF